MKILVLTIEYPPLGGGASPMIHENNKSYLAQGHQVTVVTMGYKDLSPDEVYEGVRVIRVNARRSKKHLSYPLEHALFILNAKRSLKVLLSGETFDVCHTHFMIPTGILSKWVRKKYQIPYIITVHGSDIPGFNPHRFLFMHRFTPGLIRSIITASAAIVTPSQYLGELVQKVMKIDHEKLIFIPNGVDTNYFKPELKRNIILSSGRLLERKGFQYLLEAIASEKLNYEVHILGDGPMMEELKKKASTSLTPIIMHGWIDNRSAFYQKLISETSIYCLVSTHENASISLVEALSCGCAVITSNVSGCPETVGDAGLCIEPENPDLLRATILQLIEDDEYRKSLMQKGRQRAIQHFHSDNLAKKYIELMTSIASS